jgi:hypothetical protein
MSRMIATLDERAEEPLEAAPVATAQAASGNEAYTLARFDIGFHQADSASG